MVDKPFGLAVHGGSFLAQNLVDVLRARRHAEASMNLDGGGNKSSYLELAHRLDRDTSGVLVEALTLFFPKPNSC